MTKHLATVVPIEKLIRVVREAQKTRRGRRAPLPLMRGDRLAIRQRRPRSPVDDPA